LSPSPSAQWAYSPIRDAHAGAVIALVDGAANERAVAETAAFLADGLRLPLALVAPAPGRRSTIPDPFDWSARRTRAHRDLVRLRDTLGIHADEVSLHPDGLEEFIGSGSGVRGSAPLVVVPQALIGRDLADHVKLLVRGQAEAVLIVPPGYRPDTTSTLSMLVPLDGSSDAQAALSLATRMAQRLDAELVLASVVPDSIFSFGAPAATDLALKDELQRHNRAAACAWLEQTRRHLADQGLAVSSRCLTGDARSSLRKLVSELAPDVVVLSPRGRGGESCRDLEIGSTARFLVENLETPVLLTGSRRIRQESPSIDGAQVIGPRPAQAA
jgi:nucleotide-binding universal stress UspA family protein